MRRQGVHLFNDNEDNHVSVHGTNGFLGVLSREFLQRMSGALLLEANENMELKLQYSKDVISSAIKLTLNPNNHNTLSGEKCIYIMEC